MFSQACVKNSVHGGALPQCMLGYTSHGQTPPWANTPPPLQQTATAADATHPTGMHSCSTNLFIANAPRYLADVKTLRVASDFEKKSHTGGLMSGINLLHTGNSILK